MTRYPRPVKRTTDTNRLPIALPAIAIAAAVALALFWRHAHSSDDDATRESANDPSDYARAEPMSPIAPPPGTEPRNRGSDIEPDASVTAIDHTVRNDPALHDEVRARILAAWRDGLFAAHASQPGQPAGDASNAPGGPGNLEPGYIRDLVRGEFVPMARTCYEQQLQRDAAAHGRISLAFTIMGDPHAGGIVDDVRFDAPDSGATWDDTFRTCMQETMRTMVFRAPTGGGRVTVRYPFNLEPDPHDG